MVAGEPAVVLGGDPTSSDGKAAYISFGPGLVKKLATAEDMRDEIYNQTQNIIQEVEEGVADDVERAESAAQSVTQSATQIAQNTQDISDIKADLSELEPGLSDDAKAALLACFDKVAWLDGEVPDALAELEAALYADDYPRLSVIFNPDKVKIYDDFTEQNIRDLMTVRYYRAKGDFDVVTNYTLAYSLTTAVTQIAVSYNGLSKSITTDVILGRPLTINDVASSIGYNDFTVDEDGNISSSSSLGFSVVVLDQSIKHIRYTPLYRDILTRKDVSSWMAFNKNAATGFICSDTANIYQFTQNGNRYTASKDNTLGTVVLENYSSFTGQGRKDMVLNEGALVVTEANNPIAKITATVANQTGWWSDGSQNSRPQNVRVYTE